mmetsp:Transcript_47787/g.133230  ORF Transcript_47787/g.133230 Transcript_47787/m.133230 type:complete len:222 (+) Transcript_47787:849-1514(+)
MAVEGQNQLLRNDAEQAADGTSEGLPDGVDILYEGEWRPGLLCDVRKQRGVVVGSEAEAVDAATDLRRACHQRRNTRACRIVLAVGEDEHGGDCVALPPLLQDGEAGADAGRNRGASTRAKTQHGYVGVVFPRCIHPTEAQHPRRRVVERHDAHAVRGAGLVDHEAHGALHLLEFLPAHGAAHVKNADQVHGLALRFLRVVGIFWPWRGARLHRDQAENLL